MASCAKAGAAASIDSSPATAIVLIEVIFFLHVVNAGIRRTGKRRRTPQGTCVLSNANCSLEAAPRQRMHGRDVGRRRFRPTKLPFTKLN
jgi:hypothetical protein